MPACIYGVALKHWLENATSRNKSSIPWSVKVEGAYLLMLASWLHGLYYPLNALSIDSKYTQGFHKYWKFKIVLAYVLLE